jgi:SAM-dependent methyltransferase
MAKPGAVCDLCGSRAALPVLTAPGLDGPLVRCGSCGLCYIPSPGVPPPFAAPKAEARDRLVRDTIRRYPNLARAEEERLNLLNARWRLDLIRRHRDGGRLLEVGCGRGDFLKAASESFEVWGVEPDPNLAGAASSRARVFNGFVGDAPWTDFDIAASFHVIEHVPSPSRFLEGIAGRLRPGGLLVVETPDIGSWPFRIRQSRWRQFIPGHHFFFDRTTLPRLLEKCGFRLDRLSRVGKYASPALILNRASRRIPGLRRASERISSVAFPVNPGDIMLAIATKLGR